MQGFYVNMVYHSFAVKSGGDPTVLDEPSWVQAWVALMKQVQQSDVCKVTLPVLPMEFSMSLAGGVHCHAGQPDPAV